MKKMILGLGLVIGVVAIMGCGGGTTDVNGGQPVTKQRVNDVQQKLQEAKAEALKIQMDESLTKEQKAQKLEALQAEIKESANTK